ncbi:MAG: hypothetical protein IRY90_03390, partial [Actinomadura rubrobrunea]|nr:hypothetical protein [Actinomadura rubrobrunea]
LAVGYAARISPQMMFAAAVFSYLGKIVAMLALVAVLDGVTLWNTAAFAWSVIALTLVWVVAEARAAMKIKTLSLDPAGAPGVTRDRSP